MRNNAGRRGRPIPGNNVLHYLRMRKRLAAIAAAAAISASGILFASAPAALADTSYCTTTAPNNICEVSQSTAVGYASAYATFDSDTKLSWGTFANESGYNMNVWVEIDYGDGNLHTVWGPVAMPYDIDAPPITSPNFYDGGYLTYSCFQFTSWSGAAVHCTAGV